MRRTAERTLGRVGLRIGNARCQTGEPSSQLTLVQALSEELAYERREFAEPELAKQAPPFGFQLQDSAASSTLELTRSSKREHVSLSLDVNATTELPPDSTSAQPADQAEGDADSDADDTSLSVPFTATVSKYSQQLVFLCSTDGSELGIRRVALEGPSFDSSSSTDSCSATFDELDERLQTAFTAYLATRGIDSSMCEYLASIFDSKEQRRYIRWLDQAYQFVADDGDST